MAEKTVYNIPYEQNGMKLYYSGPETGAPASSASSSSSNMQDGGEAPIGAGPYAGMTPSELEKLQSQPDYSLPESPDITPMTQNPGESNADFKARILNEPFYLPGMGGTKRTPTGKTLPPEGKFYNTKGELEDVNPPEGYTRDASGRIVPTINRSIRSTSGTEQNVIVPGSRVGGSGSIGVSGYETAAEKSAREYLDTSFKAPKTEEEIIAERTTQSRDKIAALNDYYAGLLSNQAPVNELRTREANAQAVLHGLGGSTEAGTMAVVAEQKNAQANKAIMAERAMKLADIYSGIQDFAHTEAQRQKNEAMGSAKDILARGEANRKTAIEHLSTIAANPEFDLEKIRLNDPETYSQLVQSVGGEEYLKGIVFAKRPQATIMGQPTRIGDYMQQNIKQTDGTVKSEYIKLPDEILATDSKNFKTTNTDNGTFFTTDGGKTWKQLENSMKPVTSKANVTISKDLIRQGDQKLAATRGPDGYANPTVYQQAFTDWVNGTSTHAPIGTAKEFLANFPPKNYVNPENTWLPTYLRPTGSAKTKATTTSTTKARF